MQSPSRPPDHLSALLVELEGRLAQSQKAMRSEPELLRRALVVIDQEIACGGSPELMRVLRLLRAEIMAELDRIPYPDRLRDAIADVALKPTQAEKNAAKRRRQERRKTGRKAGFVG